MRRLRPSLTTVMQDERGQTLGRCGEVLRAHRVLGLGEEGLGRLGGGQSQQDRVWRLLMSRNGEQLRALLHDSAETG